MKFRGCILEIGKAEKCAPLVWNAKWFFIFNITTTGECGRVTQSGNMEISFSSNMDSEILESVNPMEGLIIHLNAAIRKPEHDVVWNGDPGLGEHVLWYNLVLKKVSRADCTTFLTMITVWERVGNVALKYYLRTSHLTLREGDVISWIMCFISVIMHLEFDLMMITEQKVYTNISSDVMLEPLWLQFMRLN